jgi:hypothetical protein
MPPQHPVAPSAMAAAQGMSGTMMTTSTFCTAHGKISHFGPAWQKCHARKSGAQV